MTEKEILKKIDVLHGENEIQMIIDFIESLPEDEVTPEIVSQLGRAYNNLYWLDPQEKAERFLNKAVSVLITVENELSQDAAWNFRIAYSYFYLDQKEEAKKHFEKYVELGGDWRGSLNYLLLTNKAINNDISTSEVIKGGIGGVEYSLEHLKDLIKEKAPKVGEILNEGASMEEISELEDWFGVSFPDDLRQYFRTFNGQSQNRLVLNGNRKFLQVDEVKRESKRWHDMVVRVCGDNWRIFEQDENFFDAEGLVKNTAYNRGWIPIMSGDVEGLTIFVCYDTDPDEEGEVGQLITVRVGDDISKFGVNISFYSLEDMVNNFLDFIDEGKYVYNEERGILEFSHAGYLLPTFYQNKDRVAVEEYVRDTFGEITQVIDGKIEGIDYDIYVIGPDKDRDYYTLTTIGMGSYDMELPEGFSQDVRNCELMINLPPWWDVNGDRDVWEWPIKWMWMLGRLPKAQNTYFGVGHTIPSEELLPGTNFDCIMLTYAKTGGNYLEDSTNICYVDLPSGKRVFFYYMIPLYPSETAYKLDNTSVKLHQRFDKIGIPYPPIVNLDRVDSCKGYTPEVREDMLNNVKWAFSGNTYDTSMHLWEDLYKYNNDIENNIDDFSPFSIIFPCQRVRVIYEAYIEDEDELWEWEDFFNFEDADKEEPRLVEIICDLDSEQDTFSSIEFLRMVHNSLSNKELNGNIFFEAIEIEGQDQEGVPIIRLILSK